jgi:hypothetical protein
MEKKDPPLSSVAVSIAALLFIGIVVPLILGGAISLAAAFGGEQSYLESPDDANGFKWATGPNGARTITSSTTMSTTSQQNTGGSVDEAFTSTLPCYSSAGCRTSTMTNPIRLHIPDVFNGSDDLSKFSWKWYSSSYGTSGSCSQYSAGWTFDYWLDINGTIVFKSLDAKTDGYHLIGPNCYSHWEINETIDIVELNDIREEYDKCEPDCLITLNFHNISKGSTSGFDYSKPFDLVTGKMKVETFTLQAADGELVLTVTPWVITVAMLAISLASTDYWNPLGERLKQSIDNMSGGNNK